MSLRAIKHHLSCPSHVNSSIRPVYEREIRNETSVGPFDFLSLFVKTHRKLNEHYNFEIFLSVTIRNRLHQFYLEMNLFKRIAGQGIHKKLALILAVARVKLVEALF